jgi:hypothetical protein
MTINHPTHNTNSHASVLQKSRLMAQGNRQQGRQRQQSALMRSLQGLQ